MINKQKNSKTTTDQQSPNKLDCNKIAFKVALNGKKTAEDVLPNDNNHHVITKMKKHEKKKKLLDLDYFDDVFELGFLLARFYFHRKYCVRLFVNRLYRSLLAS